MGERFDLASVLKDVSKLDTSERDHIEYIDADQIETDPANFYHLSDLPELAANIELVGLQQPLRVRYIANNRYRIVSGHRRKAAISLLISEGKEQFRQIPCIVENCQCSEAMQELRLIYANSDTRKMSSAELSKQAERVEMLLYRLKEEGINFPGRMRDHVAEACKLSKTKLARLKVIRDGLAEDFKKPFENQQISENVAYSLARLPEEFQQRLFRVISPGKLNGSALEKMIEMYASGWRWEMEQCCPSGKRCTHADAALRHDLADYWNMCGGNKCCLECEHAFRDWSPCSNACSKAKQKREETMANEREKKDKELQKATNRYQQLTQENAKRLIPVIDALNLSENTLLPICPRGDCAIKGIRKYAEGVFEGNERWYEERISREHIKDAKKTAQILKCSTDYLFGLTEDPMPKEERTTQQGEMQWMSGANPPENVFQLAVVQFALEGMEKPLYKIAEWRACAWHFPNAGAVIDAKCLKWLPLNKEGE